MNNHSQIERGVSTSEQESKTNQESAWDILTKIPESETWDEHLEKANSLKSSARELTTRDTKDLLNYSDVARHNKKTFFKNLAQQEKLERELNSELSHVEDLELLAEAEDPRVEKTTIKYQNQDIPVYILKDYPFKFLSHILNYREGDYISKTGTKVSDELVNNPKMWSEPYQPPEPKDLIGGWAADHENARSNTLSTSYADGTLRSFDEDLAHGNGNRQNSIMYGFDHVRPMSLIYAKANDGQIPNYVEQGKSHYDRPIKALASSIDQLDTSKGTDFSPYNEVAMCRYDENNQPIQPSFLVTDNLNVLRNTETAPEETTYWTGEPRLRKIKALRRRYLAKLRYTSNLHARYESRNGI